MITSGQRTRPRARSVGRISPSQKPRVALVAHDIDSVGGMERVCAELIRRGAGSVDFVVISTSLHPELRHLVEWHRVRAFRRPIPLKFAAFFLVAGLRLRRVHVDLVHTVGPIVPNRADLISMHFCHAGFRSRIGRLAPPGGSFLRRANTSLLSALSLLAERWSFRPGRTRTLAAVSEGIGREIDEHYPAIPRVVTPNGVDTARFKPDSRTRAFLRANQSVTDDDRVILFVGGDWQRKGLEIALRGVALAQRTTKQRLFLWVVGRGREERLRSLAQALDFPRLQFFGMRADVERFYQAADIFVAPSLYEAFALAAFEAAACGVAIVATRVSGIEDLLGLEDEAGLLVDRTSEDVGRAVGYLIANPDVRDHLARQARERVLGYTWDRSVGRVLELYRQLLRGQRREDV
jgi:glycosyltransferase involved in cell wall biosynthesis